MENIEGKENLEAVFTLAECLKYADETEALILKKGALADISGILSNHFSDKAICLIADGNTWKAAGQSVKNILEASKKTVIGSFIFPGIPPLHADYSHVNALKDWFSTLPGYPKIVPVVTGAGTVNDLVKRASFEMELPYLCVPTAASVDGFTPNGAALLYNGFKQTMPCSAPKVLAADTEIIAKAPSYLSSSGFGDLSSKIIAGTDWIIAGKAGGLGAPEAHPIDPIPWGMVQNGLMEALNRSVDAAKGDIDAVTTLFQSLATTGFAMQYMKNSRPVSGSEHLWSHVWEMEDLSVNGVPVTHGHKVAIGTLAATAFTEILFADPNGPPEPDKTWKRPSRDERKAEVSAFFGSSQAHDLVISAAMDKMMDEKTAEALNQGFRDTWKDIRDKVLEKLIPYSDLKALLIRSECPVLPETIGLTRSAVISTSRRAQMIRNKYCVLDLAWDMGIFEKVLDKLEKIEIYLR